MTRIDRQIVQELGTLACLTLSPEECATLERELQDVLDAFATLATIDTTDAPEIPAAPVLTLRDDTVRPGLTTEQVLANAKHVDGTHLRGPRTI